MATQDKVIEFFMIGAAASPFIGLITWSWEVYSILVVVSILGTTLSASFPRRDNEDKYDNERDE